MTTPEVLEGGCQCGSIRYRINASPHILYTCHCTDCQKQSSSAFGMSLIVDAQAVEFVSGVTDLKFWDTRGGDGILKRCAFCPNCGTRLYHASEDDQQISIKAGSLDDTSGLIPIAHIWLRSAQPWIEFDPDKYHCFEQEPDNEETLAKQWQQRLSTSK
jgi:hypothetical protein